MEGALSAENLAFCELGGVVPNPRLDKVHEGIRLGRERRVDFLPAVGGGSAIDTAKAVAYGLAEPEHDVWELFAHTRTARKCLPVGCVLTIAAAGSETSKGCVITNQRTGEKRAYDDNLARPGFAVMNPEYTRTLPDYQTESGCVDIMMHTMERYFLGTPDCDLTERIAEGLLIAVRDAGRRAIANPDDYEARATLMWASSLSHNDLTGCGKPRLFPVHKLEHPVSALHDNISHGAGLSVLFPAWAQFILSKNIDVMKFAQLANRVWGVEMDFDHPERTAANGIATMKRYFIEIGMPVTMAQLGLQPEDYDAIINLTTKNGTSPVKSYIPLGNAEILEIYHLAED